MKQIKSEEQFHLWLEEGPEQGAVMKVEETSTLYKLPKHPSAQLQELLKE
ncbi:hypothetical protein [Salibacterium halotolerans]|nr:hypothetical protein [Salibacterium halotolerans]